MGPVLWRATLLGALAPPRGVLSRMAGRQQSCANFGGPGQRRLAGRAVGKGGGVTTVSYAFLTRSCHACARSISRATIVRIVHNTHRGPDSSTKS